MTSFRICHLTVNDHRHVCELINADSFIGKVSILCFWNGLHPQTLTVFLAIMLILAKR